MNSRNLWLKFAAVGLVVLLCLWPLLAGRGLRWGIDLRGGHSLIFEIRGGKTDKERLNDEKRQLEAKLVAAADEEAQKAIEQDISRVKGQIVRLADDEGSGDVAQQMIALLKQRVDPNGLRSLEWRPLSGNRIEVRMPAGKGDASSKRDAYFGAMDLLESNNIQQAEIRDVLQSPADERGKKIARYAGADEAQVDRFERLVEAYETLIAARSARDQLDKERKERLQAGDSANSLAKLSQSLAEAQGSFDDAQVGFETAQDALKAGNIDRQEFHLTLENHHFWQKQKGQKPGESTTVSESSSRKRFSSVLVIVDIDTGQKRFETNLDQLRSRFPARVEEIDEVVKLFEDWSAVRERLDDPADLQRLIAKAGVLEFRIAARLPGTDNGSAIEISEAEYKQYVESLKTEGVEGLRSRNAKMQWFPIHDADAIGRQRFILLYNQPGYQMLQEKRGAWRLVSARRDVDSRTGGPCISFDLNDAGASRMAKLTASHQTHPMAILLDDEVYSAPVIQEKAIISKSGIITGMEPEEIPDLVGTLKAGSLPARLNPNPVSQNTFGPAIGAINRDLGYKAAQWGLIVVAVFMLAYYLLSGAVADLALLLNVILILGTMSWLGAVFTLPGIAGVILTIGIAVDANVLIFERLREEQAKGQSVRMAIKNAYERAFTAIFDANITTLLTCLILGWVGTKEVRGFAITLGLGVAFSMFTALVVTRWIFQLLLDLRILKGPLPMLKIIGVPKVNWMSKRYFFWAVSVVLVTLGIVSMVHQGGDIWGIEFSSGTQVILTFRDDALLEDPATGQLVQPNDAIVRDRFKAEAKSLGFDKLESTAAVETRLNPNQVRDFVVDYDDRLVPDGKVSLAEWQDMDMGVEFFQFIDADNSGFVTRDELAKNLTSVTYQISTTEIDVDKIRQVARNAFGSALNVRTRRDFKPVAGEFVPELGVSIPADGRLHVTPALQRQVKAAYRSELLESLDGSVLVVQDVTPPISANELTQRIREMRGQPDYASQIFTKTAVVGLTPAEDGNFSSLAVVVVPAEKGLAERPAAWAEFVDAESSLLSAALARGTAMPVSNFDAAIAGEMAQRAIMAVVLSWVCIVIYVWFRFGSAQWGLAAVVCLVHDVIIVVGMVAASGWLSSTAVGQLLGVQSFKIDLAMVAAFLTVIGYSVNDTIVIFDRIRENRGKLKTVSEQVINASINQTLSRTLLTTSTTFIVVAIMYVMGGTGLHSFNYALLVGIIFGTYSSVAVASPLLMGFRKAVATRVAGEVPK